MKQEQRDAFLRVTAATLAAGPWRSAALLLVTEDGNELVQVSGLARSLARVWPMLLESCEDDEASGSVEVILREELALAEDRIAELERELEKARA